jgi:phosphoglycerate kinase
MKSVRDIGNIEGKKIFLRADFNIPFINGVIADDFRIRKTLPVIDFLRGRGADLIIASHHEKGEESLLPVFEYLKKKYKDVYFLENFYPTEPAVIKGISQNGIILLENLRKYPEEKDNDESFSQHLASFADFYVNEAFPVSHRKHASIVGVPKHIPSYVGFVFEQEVNNLSKAFNPLHPFLFVLGGAKFETKIPLIQKFFSSADRIFIGGALANDFFKAKGYSVGSSLLSKEKLILEEFFGEKLILPVDVRVKGPRGIEVKLPHEVEKEDFIVDIGPKSIENLGSVINESRFILWNGPLGNYELGFKESTADLAERIAQSSATSVVGGGDTIASISSLGIEDKFTFISTGGGAMLDFLANETLPGIEVLKD